MNIKKLATLALKFTLDAIYYIVGFGLITKWIFS
jgi:hypothetical protein